MTQKNSVVLTRHRCANCGSGGEIVSYGDEPCKETDRVIRIRGRSRRKGWGFARMGEFANDWRELWVNEKARDDLLSERHLEIEVLS